MTSSRLLTDCPNLEALPDRRVSRHRHVRAVSEEQSRSRRPEGGDARESSAPGPSRLARTLVGLSGLVGEEPPVAGHTLEHVAPAVVELNARVHDEVPDSLNANSLKRFAGDCAPTFRRPWRSAIRTAGECRARCWRWSVVKWI